MVLTAFLVVVGLMATAHAIFDRPQASERPRRAPRWAWRGVYEALSVQAATLALVGLVIGIPLGVIAGRILWQSVARPLGVIVSVDVPWAAILGAGCWPACCWPVWRWCRHAGWPDQVGHCARPNDGRACSPDVLPAPADLGVQHGVEDERQRSHPERNEGVALAGVGGVQHDRQRAVHSQRMRTLRRWLCPRRMSRWCRWFLSATVRPERPAARRITA